MAIGYGRQQCLTGTRFTMEADVLKWTGIIDDGVVPDNPEGTWITYQDPVTGEVMNNWTPGISDDDTTLEDETLLVRAIPCLARGIVDGGIRVAGTTERFGDTYENIDYVKLWVPARILLTKRDRITNIREALTGKIVWLDEEYAAGSRPTVFNVNGVTPLFDAFNKHVESFVLLEKAENYA